MDECEESEIESYYREGGFSMFQTGWGQVVGNLGSQEKLNFTRPKGRNKWRPGENGSTASNPLTVKVESAKMPVR